MDREGWRTMEGKQKVALTFGLYQNDALIRREAVSQDIVKVGKDAKSHLRVEDDQASRMHAVIEVASPDDITLIDLGNEPGTLVNNARVNKCRISVGDHVQIGGTKIILEKTEPPPFLPLSDAQDEEWHRLFRQNRCALEALALAYRALREMAPQGSDRWDVERLQLQLLRALLDGGPAEAMACCRRWARPDYGRHVRLFAIFARRVLLRRFRRSRDVVVIAAREIVAAFDDPKAHARRLDRAIRAMRRALIDLADEQLREMARTTEAH